MSNHLLAEKRVATPKPVPIKQQMQGQAVEKRTIMPRKIASDDTTVKIEVPHHQKAGSTTDMPVEKSSKSGGGPVNEKDFEGFCY